jgi:hypothetical protein
MRLTFGVMLLPVVLSFAVQSHSTVLPDSCGDDKTRFDVNTEKTTSAPLLADSSKALLVFAESIDKHAAGSCFGCNFTVRFGIDGAWAGANKGNSFFAVPIEAGEHHLCANWQSRLKSLNSNVAMTHFRAEAGQVYYFEAAIKGVSGEVTGTGNNVMTDTIWTLALSELNQDDGKYRVKISSLASFKPSR